MKKLAQVSWLAAILLAAGLSAEAQTPPLYTSGSAGISVGPISTTITFTDNHSGGNAAAFKARFIIVRNLNTSANTCMLDFADGVATTADVPLAPGASIVWPFPLGYQSTDGIPAIGAICSSTTSVKALTYTDANIAVANDTVIVTDGVTPKTYKFVASVTAEGDVLIVAGDADATILNLVRAINHSGGTPNTDWKAAAANPIVTAAKDTTGSGTGTFTVTSILPGTIGNTYSIDGTFAGSAFFADGALAGGTQQAATFYVEATR